jgi:hypothetical protein
MDRAKPVGEITRGKTRPNRLRRVDNFVAYRCGELLRHAAQPLVVDLGYGASPVTAVELRGRLAASVRRDVTVVGLEIDPVRVQAAQPYADPPGLEFRRGGFELAGLRPVVVRAFNVLRQYDESEVPEAWQRMASRLAPGGLLVEGTCDELGRVASWVGVTASGPRTFTMSLRRSGLEAPSIVAERLPKALIHRNVPGERIHELLTAFDLAWRVHAPMSVYGPSQRWIAAVATLRHEGWHVIGGPRRTRLGELTLPWEAVAPG